MTVALLPVCSNPKVAIKDGYTGAFARLYLIGYPYSYWFASGQQYTWPSATIAQDNSIRFSGLRQPDTYRKDCCDPLPGAI